ncbi:MAG TPA: IS66 family insertion sequence element accessory protein TnpB [Rhodanobacteraceae bacterium]|nr:IS66 family insertion sequence element accessory protein TnpB [Rhodanobacteraceae bacterium]
MANKADVWGERLTAWRASGLSAAAYCRGQGLSYAQFVYWQRRLARNTMAWLPVAVASPAPTAPGLTVALALPGGVRLEVTGIGVTELATLARALAC